MGMSLIFSVNLFADSPVFETIYPYNTPHENGVTLAFTGEVEYEAIATQSPPRLLLIVKKTSSFWGNYIKQFQLDPLYRVSIDEVNNHLEISLYFDIMPQYEITSPDGIDLQVSWIPIKKQNIKIHSFPKMELLNKKVSLNFKDAQMIDLLRLLANQHSLNIIAGQKVEGRITVALSKVNLGTALDAILKVNGYSWFIQDNIIVIKPKDEEMAGELSTRIYKVEYVSAESIQNALLNVLSPKGQIQVFSPVSTGTSGGSGGGAAAASPAGQQAAGGLLGALGGGAAGGGATGGGAATGGTGASAGGTSEQEVTSDHLIITDNVYNFENIEEVIETLDQPVIQVNIAVKFIEAKLSSDERLGINWDLRATISGPTDVSGTTTNADGTTTSATSLGLGWLMKDMRVATLTTPVFNMLLDVLASDNETRLIQEPQVTTTENTWASVKTGTKYPIAVPQPEGSMFGSQAITFEDQDIDITLNVKPKVNNGTYIALDLNAVVQALIGFAGPNADRPIISERSTNTKVTVENGHTLLIGGLIFDQFIQTENRIPFLGRIPYIKKFFSHSSTAVEKRELLIFITPTIVGGK